MVLEATGVGVDGLPVPGVVARAITQFVPVAAQLPAGAVLQVALGEPSDAP